MKVRQSIMQSRGKHPVIWIDLENTPHVPFFLPIILELEKRRCEVILTARDFAQTKELVEQAGLTARIIGGEYGDSAIRKALGLLWRSVRLAWFVGPYKPRLAVAHGSRGLLIASRILRIPSLILYDYEGASVRLFNRLATYVMTPEVLTSRALEGLGLMTSKHLTYPGLKEEVYVERFEPRENNLGDLALDRGKIIVTIRPPSITAHYRSDDSMKLFQGVMMLLTGRSDVQVVLMPRNATQRARLSDQWGGHAGVTIPKRALNGLDLLYCSDLVVGGGGTMNREAAVLGVPVISIFKGPLGAVDASLIQNGFLHEIDQAQEILPFLRKRPPLSVPRSSQTRDVIVEAILERAI